MHINQWNREPPQNLHTGGQMIFSKDAKTIQQKRAIFSTNDVGFGKTEYPHAKQ